MSTPRAELVEKLLEYAGVEATANIGEGQTAFSYLEGCIMGTLDEIEERAEENG